LRFIESWKWRKAQIDSGLFEVAIDGIEPDAESEPPEKAMKAEMLNVSYNEFASLAGWDSK